MDGMEFSQGIALFKCLYAYLISLKELFLLLQITTKAGIEPRLLTRYVGVAEGQGHRSPCLRPPPTRGPPLACIRHRSPASASRLRRLGPGIQPPPPASRSTPPASPGKFLHFFCFSALPLRPARCARPTGRRFVENDFFSFFESRSLEEGPSLAPAGPCGLRSPQVPPSRSVRE